MTYVCMWCHHDFSEHIELGPGKPWPCDIGAETDKGKHNWEFMRDNWRPTGDVDEGYGRSRVACDQYDAVEKLCMAHDDRPPVCSDFPWYGREPGRLGGGVISTRCSYWLDAPRDQRPDDVRPLIPISVASR